MTSVDLHSDRARPVRQAYERLSTGVPLVMAPIRLETRVLDGSPERLGIRVYPDQLHLDQHDPALTPRERQLGLEYWVAQRATASATEQLARWEMLAADLGAHRAAYVATACENGAVGVPTRGPGRYEGKVRLLPSRWVAFGFVNGEEVFAVVGQAIPADLELRIDSVGERAWLTDYGTALRLGMAIEVELTGPARGFLDAPNELIVVGIRAGLDEVAGAAELADTLQHHAWAGGLGIAAQGRPTNAVTGPTGETVGVEPTPVPPPVLPAGVASPDRLGPIDGPIDQGPIDHGPIDHGPPTPRLVTDGQRLTTALGLADADLLVGVPNGNGTQVGAMAHMNEVVWPVTLGEMLRRLLAGEDGHHAFPDIDVDAAHDFFVSSVRGGGPLPAMRIRDQPYGVLPVRLLDALSFGDDRRGDLLRLLTGLTGQWDDGVDRVARMDGVGTRVGEDLDGLLVELLAGQPDPWSFETRRLDVVQEAEPDYLWLLIFGIILPSMGLVTFHAALVTRLLQLVAEDPFAGEYVELASPLADPVANYATPFLHRQAVDTLRNALVAARDAPVPDELPDGPFIIIDLDWDGCIAICDSLLELIDLHEARLFPLLSRSGEVSAVFPDVHDPAIGFGLFDATSTAWAPEWPLVEAPGAPVEQTAAAYLTALADEARAGGTNLVLDTPGFTDDALPEPMLAQLARQAVNRARSGATPGPALPTALDNLTLRDPDELAMLLRQSLGIVSYRLDAWFTAVATDALDAMRASTAEGCHVGGYGWVENLQRGADSETEGFIQAPSLNHAITAAILRSGWKAHGDAQASSALAVDLSSARVRTAAELLDGVRGGVSLGDLMGHRIERALHDAFLDSWIEPCRRAVLDATGRAGEAAVAPVDGLMLAGLWAHGAAGNALEAAIGPVAAIVGPLRDLDAAIDAVVDATTAESVYQLVQGNLDRAAATFDAVATGQVAPPPLDVALTPRRSRAVTHRLGVVLEPVEADPAQVSKAAGVLAAVAPAVDRFVRDVLPDGSRVVGAAEWGGRRTAVSLADLAVEGLDAMHLVGADGDTSALLHRIRLAGAKIVGATGDLHTVDVDLADTMGEAGGVSMTEFAALAASLRRLLADARTLRAVDLDIDQPDMSVVADGPDPDAPVADAIVGRLASAHRDIAAVLGTTAGGAATYGAPLDELARLQVRGALRPLTDDPESWQRVATAAIGVAAQRLTRLADGTARTAAERIRIALGVRLPLPHAVEVLRPDVLADAARRAAEAVPEPGTAVPGWLQRLRRTRPGLATFDDVTSAVEVFDTGPLEFQLVQLPVDRAARWVIEAVPDQNTLHVVLASAGSTSITPRVTGLVVDDWVEPVPLADVDSGLAFHFDTPGAEAPQAVLLALPPEGATTWSATSVAATVRTTLAMVRRRAVGPPELAAAGSVAPLGHYIPATNLPEPLRFPAVAS